MRDLLAGDLCALSCVFFVYVERGGGGGGVGGGGWPGISLMSLIA